MQQTKDLYRWIIHLDYRITSKPTGTYGELGNVFEKRNLYLT